MRFPFLYRECQCIHREKVKLSVTISSSPPTLWFCTSIITSPSLLIFLHDQGKQYWQVCQVFRFHNLKKSRAGETCIGPRIYYIILSQLFLHGLFMYQDLSALVSKYKSFSLFSNTLHYKGSEILVFQESFLHRCTLYLNLNFSATQHVTIIQASRAYVSFGRDNANVFSYSSKVGTWTNTILCLCVFGAGFLTICFLHFKVSTTLTSIDSHGLFLFFSKHVSPSLVIFRN